MKSRDSKNAELISIIVPVYNVEPFLNRCIESIVEQTYQNLEIILVDDGSPDNCPMICDVWAQKDHRIKVLHIKNGGAGNARNIGLETAKGDWISYVDADDYLDTHMYEYLLSLCNDNIDLAECRVLETDQDFAAFSPIGEFTDNIITANTEEALKYHIHDIIFRQTPPNKICRAEIAKEVKFPVGKLIDDEFWAYQLIGKCKRLVHSDYRLYAYRQRSGSAMHIDYSLKRLQALEAKSVRLDYVRKNFPRLEVEAKNNLWMSCLYHGQQSLMKLDRGERKHAIKEIKQILKEYPLNYREIMKLKMTHRVWVLLECISLSTTCHIRNILKIGV